MYIKFLSMWEWNIDGINKYTSGGNTTYIYVYTIPFDVQTL
jgi:hypothetical protein